VLFLQILGEVPAFPVDQAGPDGEALLLEAEGVAIALAVEWLRRGRTSCAPVETEIDPSAFKNRTF